MRKLVFAIVLILVLSMQVSADITLTELPLLDSGPSLGDRPDIHQRDGHFHP